MIMKDHTQGQRPANRYCRTHDSDRAAGTDLLQAFIAHRFPRLVIYFAGFNFLEAGLPARLSMLADDDVRGASLGVFSSAQFLGAFVGGLIGGRFLGQGRPQDVFFVCALLAGIWLALQGFGKPASKR